MAGAAMSHAVSQSESDKFIFSHLSDAGRGRRRALPVRYQRLDGVAASAVMMDYSRDVAVSGEWYAEDTHYFDMILSDMPSGRRPVHTRGCFPDAFGDFRAVGKVLFAPAGHRFQGWGGRGSQRTLSVFLDQRVEFADEAGFDADPERALHACVNLQCEAVQRLLLTICREVCQPSFASSLMIEGLAFTALAEALRLLRSPPETAKGGLPPWRLRLIEERLRDGEGIPTIAELAELCRLSRRQLMRAFQQETGSTIGAFVQRVATDRARDRLLSSDKPVRLIALECGFSNPSAFATAFRRATGQTPRDFRNLRAAAR